MMDPLRPVTGEGSRPSMCAPTSLQRVNTVLRLTWITCPRMFRERFLVKFFALFYHLPRSWRGEFKIACRVLLVLTYLVKIGVWKLLTGMSPLDAGTIDQDADLVAVCEDLGHQLCYLVGRAEICRVDGGFPAQGLDSLECGCIRFISLCFKCI